MIASRHKVKVQFFPKRNRLVSDDRFFSLRSVPNGLKFNRLGVVVGRSVSALAVKRNRLKRAIFDSFESAGGLERLEGKSGEDLVFFAKPPAGDLSKEELIEKIRSYVQSF